jgi:hypothetical protein
MRFALVLALLAASLGRAQMIINPARLSASAKSFEPAQDERQLKCDVSPLRPSLNFSLRFQAGYLVRVPMSQYFGPGHRWAVFVRITPEQGAQPVYLIDRIAIPEVPKTKVELEFGGIYFVGEGRYRVDWKMLDDSGRFCRKHWSFEVKRGRSERRLDAGLPPGTITDFTLRGVRRAAPRPVEGAGFRLTILMHTAPLSPRRTRLGARDRVMLTGTLSALLERLPTRSVRMVAFSLDQQKELFRQENFVLQDIDRVARSINEIEMGTVDYTVLQNRRGHTELLAQLLNQELNHEHPSDVVLVLGPTSRYFDRLPGELLEKPSNPLPRFFFLRYGPALIAQATVSDSISMAISRLRGKTIMIHMPGDFAKAIEMLERERVSGN